MVLENGMYGALHGLISLNNHADLDIRSWSYQHAAAQYDARSRSGVKRHTLHSKKKVGSPSFHEYTVSRIPIVDVVS